MSEPTIAVGDIFEDLDPRARRNGAQRPRLIKVVGMEVGRPPRLVVVDLDTGRRTRIRWDRLTRGGLRGYRRVGYDPAYGPRFDRHAD